MRNTEFLTLRSVSTNRDLRGCSRSWGGPVWPQAEARPPYVCVPLLTLLASQGTAGRGSPFCSKLCWREVGSSLPDSTAASRSCYCPSSGDLSATQLCGHLSQLLNRASPVTGTRVRRGAGSTSEPLPTRGRSADCSCYYPPC